MAPLDRSNVLIRGVVGSTAYGLAHEGSDVDQLGVFCAPMDEVLGLRGPRVVEDSSVTHEPDVTLHEVGKYVRLALDCNPTILEVLWLPEHEILTDAGRLLVEHRALFLSGKAVKGRFGGYARSQAERLVRRSDEGKEGFSSDVRARTAKHGRHCTRLLMQGAELLRTGSMTVRVSEPDRDYIFAQGELAAADPHAFHTEALARLAEFDAIESVLPVAADREAANRLVLDIRWSFPPSDQS